MKKVLIVVPHPDDETLGCGGTLLKHAAAGDHLYWLIATEMTSQTGFSEQRMQCREKEIKAVAGHYGFREVIRLGYSTTCLDREPLSELVRKISCVLDKVKPQIMYVPFYGDIHTDHRIISSAVSSCTKWFRNSFWERILAYETPSETGYCFEDVNIFKPNTYIDISKYLEKKTGIMKLYHGETHEFPFPRSRDAVQALALHRGAEAGYKAAEAFVLLRERIS